MITLNFYRAVFLIYRYVICEVKLKIGMLFVKLN